MAQSIEIVCIGSVIVDLYARVTDTVLAERFLTKGEMHIVTSEQAAALRRSVNCDVRLRGGSAANVAVGLASLGCSSGLIAGVGDDTDGVFIEEELLAQHVVFLGTRTPNAYSSQCIVLVTPEGQRTLCTCLSPVSSITADQLRSSKWNEVSAVHIEGHLWADEPSKLALETGILSGKLPDTRISVSLPDVSIIRANRSSFWSFLVDTADVIVGNEAEFLSLCAATELGHVMDALRSAAFDIAAITRGQQGCLIVTQDAMLPVAAESVRNVVDSTGAGDLFAAGLLFGTVRGFNLEECGRLAARCGAEAVTHLGATPRLALAKSE
jgi:sugar/nucleoside kinase (ribokinase family)